MAVAAHLAVETLGHSGKEVLGLVTAMVVVAGAAEPQVNLALAVRSFLSSEHAALRRDPEVRRCFGLLVCLFAGVRDWAAVQAGLESKSFAEAMSSGCRLPCFRRRRFDRNRPAPKRESKLSSELWGQASRAASHFDFLIDLRSRPCHRTATGTEIRRVTSISSYVSCYQVITSEGAHSFKEDIRVRGRASRY